MRRSTAVLGIALVLPLAGIAAQVARPGASSSLIGAAAEFVRTTWTSTTGAVLEVDPRRALVDSRSGSAEQLHTSITLAGVARKGAIVIAKADSARACAGPKDPKRHCALNAMVAFGAPVVHGDTATVVGFVRAVYPASIAPRAGPTTITFSLLLLREGGKWWVAGKREIGHS